MEQAVRTLKLFAVAHLTSKNIRVTLALLTLAAVSVEADEGCGNSGGHFALYGLCGGPWGAFPY